MTLKYLKTNSERRPELICTCICWMQIFTNKYTAACTLTETVSKDNLSYKNKMKTAFELLYLAGGDETLSKPCQTIPATTDPQTPSTDISHTKYRRC